MTPQTTSSFPILIKEPEKKAKSLVRKLCHSGEAELDKELLDELRYICKSSRNDIVITSVFKEAMQCLQKNHSQVRLSTLKLLDYLFRKTHYVREKLLGNFDTFIRLTLAIQQDAKKKIELPPPKRFAAVLKETTVKFIHAWHADYGKGYERLRYVYKDLREHRLVDFDQFRVSTREDLLRQQMLAEKQERILNQSITNRLKELSDLKPDIEQLLVQIESSVQLLVPETEAALNEITSDLEASVDDRQHHGIANIGHSIQIEFSPYVEVKKTEDNIDLVKTLKDLKNELVTGKLTKLISIEKTLQKKSDEFVYPLRDIIDLKSRCAAAVIKLSELKITNEDEERRHATLDDACSESESDSDFEDVGPKEGLELYIPKSQRYEYGLEPIDPRELQSKNRCALTEETFEPEPSSSNSSRCDATMVLACNVKLDSGKLCPRRDKIKCPFHGLIIARDHNGNPINEADRLREEASKSKRNDSVPEWQDPEFLRDIQAATGIDLTMPTKRSRVSKDKTCVLKVSDAKKCDITTKQRIQKRLKMLKK